MGKLKEKIEAWWYLGDQDKTQKILFGVVFVAVLYFFILPALKVIMGIN